MRAPPSGCRGATQFSLRLPHGARTSTSPHRPSALRATQTASPFARPATTRRTRRTEKKRTSPNRTSEADAEPSNSCASASIQQPTLVHPPQTRGRNGTRLPGVKCLPTCCLYCSETHEFSFAVDFEDRRKSTAQSPCSEACVRSFGVYRSARTTLSPACAWNGPSSAFHRARRWFHPPARRVAEP